MNKQLPLFLCLWSFMLFMFSCNKADQVSSIPNPDLFKGSSITLNVSTASGVLRTVADTSDPMRKVDNLTFVFYARQSEDQSYAVAHVEERMTPEGGGGSVTLNLVPGDYKLLVIANILPQIKALIYPDAPISLVEQPLLSSLSDLKTSIDGKPGVQHVNTIPMTNDQGFVDINARDFQSAGQATTAIKPIKVSISPILARVVLEEQDLKVLHGKTHGAGAYYISALPKSVFIMRQMAKLANSDTHEVAGDGSDVSKRYAYAPGYQKISIQDPSTIDFNHLYYTSTLTDDQWPLIKPMQTSAPADIYNYAMYAKESTMPPSCFVEGVVPQVIVRYSYIPDALKHKTESDVVEGWARFETSYYTRKELLAHLKNSQLAKQQPRLAAAIEAIKKEAKGEAMLKLEKGFASHGLSYYHRAYNYYFIFVRHFDDTLAPTDSSYGRYGLVRNNDYRIKIKTIGQEGKPSYENSVKNLKPIYSKVNSPVEVGVVAPVDREQEVYL